MSKHQELCCGCMYDNIENECYCEECFDCEYVQGDKKPSKYEEQALKGGGNNDWKYNS